MSRQIPEGQGHEKLVANRLGVATQGIPVATLSKYVATQSKSKPREQVTIENKKLGKRQQNPQIQPQIQAQHSITV